MSNHSGLEELEFDKWLATRPENIKAMARKFPPGTSLKIEEEICWIVGYDEADALYVSRTNPFEDYQKAVDSKFPIHLECLKTKGIGGSSMGGGGKLP